MTPLELREPKPARFEGEFFLEPAANAAPSLDELSLAGVLRAWMDRLAALPLKADGFDPSRLEARRNTAKDLRLTADAYLTQAIDAAEAVIKLHVVRGRHELRLEAISQQPFGVSLLDDKNNDVSNDKAALADDILISVHDVPLSEAHIRLKSEIDTTLGVVRAVVPRGHSSRQDAVRSRYIRDLWGIARVGLESRQATVAVFAERSLERFRANFTLTEAERVKNRYLKKLGGSCAVVAIVAFTLFALIRFGLDTQTKADSYLPAFASWPGLRLAVFELRNFLLLIGGAAGGAWLSFALRRVILEFADLAKLEEDQLDPKVRVVFVSLLATVVGLLLFTEAITLGMGRFIPRVGGSGLWALLLGLLLGIAERTIASAVYRRATDFGGGVGGK